MIKTKKNKKLRISLILCSLFICICSILCLVPFNNEKTIVKADTTTSVYEFIGSDIYFPNVGVSDVYSSTYNFRNFSSYIDKVFRFSVSLDFDSVSDPITIKTVFNSFSQNYSSRSQIGWSFSDSNLSDRSISMYAGDNMYVGSNYDYSYGYQYLDMYGYLSGNVILYSSVLFEIVYMGDLPNDFLGNESYGDIVSVEFGNYSKKSAFVGLANGLEDLDGNLVNINGYYNYVSYIFSSGFRFNILIPTTYNSRNSYSYYPYSYFQTRTYNIPNTTTSDYNNGYNYGYTEGYNKGNQSGYEDGYDEGYGVGNNIGFNNGYTEGVDSANDYTFLSLISATIDAPVSYFQSLFNFELLGVNLQGFLTGLFTLCVIVTIFKLCLGGK